MKRYRSRLPLNELFLSRLAISDTTSVPDRNLVRDLRPSLPPARPGAKPNGEFPPNADPIALLPRWWKTLRGMVTGSLIMGLTLLGGLGLLG